MRVETLRGFWLAAKATYLSIFKYKEALSHHLRRIAIKEDKEYKSRPFAIFEYISQAALTPLHETIFRVLKDIPQDATFDQNKGFRDILYGGYKFYASFDLSSATDRFPLEVQKMVMNHLIGPEKTEAWTHIMTGYPFRLPTKEVVSFAVGQPLGAKSS